MGTFIRFERGRDDVIGPTFGPFEYVQFVLGQLTAQPIRGPQRLLEDLAQHMACGDWVLGDDAFEHRGEYYSDMIIFQGGDVPEMLDPKHSCEAAMKHLEDYPSPLPESILACSQPSWPDRGEGYMPLGTFGRLSTAARIPGGRAP